MSDRETIIFTPTGPITEHRAEIAGESLRGRIVVQVYTQVEWNRTCAPGCAQYSTKLAKCAVIGNGPLAFDAIILAHRLSSNAIRSAMPAISHIVWRKDAVQVKPASIRWPGSLVAHAPWHCQLLSRSFQRRADNSRNAPQSADRLDAPRFRVTIRHMKHAALAAISLVFLLPSITHAWGGDGHQIVCLIAEDHLTPTAKAGIHELLGKDVNISDAEIASWADEVRRQRRELSGCGVQFREGDDQAKHTKD